MSDLQQRRARQYAVCTYALQYDRITDGSEGVFDQALTNGLAAIVNHEWPGAELDKHGHVLSANRLLSVVEERGKHAEEGVVRILRPGEPEWSEPAVGLFDADDDRMPNFTNVKVATLREAIVATQEIRHARDRGEEPASLLADAHVEALQELDFHPALFALTDEVIERAEAGIATTAAAERGRASAYWAALDEEERQRRRAIDYSDVYAWETKDGRCEVQECPVCWTSALVAEEFDSYLDELGVGTCMACSYQQTRDIADDEAMMIDIRRRTERDD